MADTKDVENGKATQDILTENSECKEMVQLRTYLDKLVDVLVTKMARNQFLDAIPDGVDKQFAKSLQDRFCSVMRVKLCKIIEERLSEYNFDQKLKLLSDMTKNTPNAVSHKAWRPPPSDTVQSCVKAHDLQVLNQHKAKLSELISSAELETKDLEIELQEVHRRVQENASVLKNMTSGYQNIVQSLDTIIKNHSFQ